MAATEQLTATTHIIIKAPVEKAWQALVDPDMIKKYLFGTTVRTDWKKGSPITYTGEWQGKSYEDKGTIIDIEPGKRLHTTYFSSMSGKADKPENYVNVYYEVETDIDGQTKVTIIQDGIEGEDQVKHMEQNWETVLKGMKALLEK